MIAKPNAAFLFARACKGATIALALLASSMTAGAADSPFSNLGGSWSGPGVITLNTGAKERIRCRATYDVDRSGDNLSIAIRCASDSYKFNLQGSITHSRGAVTGVWSESTYGVGGTIVGRGAPGRIQVRAEGMVVNALLALTTRENRQLVSISSPGSPLSEVAISMSRGR